MRNALDDFVVEPCFAVRYYFEGLQHRTVARPEVRHRRDDQLGLADKLRLAHRVAECSAPALERGVVAVHVGRPQHTDGQRDNHRLSGDALLEVFALMPAARSAAFSTTERFRFHSRSMLSPTRFAGAERPTDAGNLLDPLLEVLDGQGVASADHGNHPTVGAPACGRRGASQSHASRSAHW